MIEAIVPIPSRIPIDSVLCGTQIIDDGARQKEPIISGRSIRIVPLMFYKVFSVWSGVRYEHMFATDEAIDPISLLKYQDYTGRVTSDNGGGILIPISVKRVSEYGAATFLFSSSINFLLTHYRDNIPICTLPPLDDRPWDQHAITTTPHMGVESYGAFELHAFEPAINSMWAQWKLSSHYEMSIATMTPEQPSHITDCVREICTVGSSDALFSYIDDIMVYETGAHVTPDMLVDKYVYDHFPLDPITQWCVLSPSYIMARQLRPYLASPYEMSKYRHIGYNPQDDDFTREFLNVSFSSSINVSWAYEFVEKVCSLSDTHFRLRVTWDSFYPEVFSIFGYKTYIDTTSHCTYESLSMIIKQLFLNKFVNKDAYDDVVVSKNWTDEIYISCNKQGCKPVTYYISLAWFHLMSPSLINKDFFVKL